MARVALERDDIELVAINDPFITPEYMVNYFSSGTDDFKPLENICTLLLHYFDNGALFLAQY